MSQKKTAATIADQLRVRPGSTVTVDDFDPRATPGYPGAGKKDAPELVQGMADELSDLQERLYANGRDNPEAKRVLLILQGLDTSGKGGVIRHSVGMVDPQGIQLHAFKAPTEEERKHDYLWRIRRELPTAGMIGIFDRSQYEDVLIARVDELVPESVWSKRFNEINAFEAEVAAQGTTIIKCFLNVSHDKQKERLLERLDNPEKYWKYNPGDVDTRSKWSAYMAAYADVLTRCSTEVAPWYVIPADRKWYRNWAVTTLLLEHLRKLDPQWPPADFDVAEQRRRVEES
ncbi:phosphate--nucleotide phosphotransferase [Enemella evansiae]|uniref:Phosphate--nucleotide phosphotransferase n=1 Tax=Enemella evansiae TaxID=2016499 RepID=A0A255G3J9_9ACTN|nr:polyphosphate kinase 2 family protein [Enemella evansiae]OYO10489.1 phosphate--nucleotide phosphotransferase [Enemella evansiae]